MAMSCRTASYFSSKPVAATALLPLVSISFCANLIVARIVHTKYREKARNGRSEDSPILYANLDFFVKTLCAVPRLLPLHAARLPRFRGTAPASRDTYIDAEESESVSRVTLLSYTLNSLYVNVFLPFDLPRIRAGLQGYHAFSSCPYRIPSTTSLSSEVAAYLQLHVTADALFNVWGA